MAARQDGWEVLRDCPIGGSGRKLDFVLLHPQRGVVLISAKAVAPGEALPQDRLRRSLEDRRFPAIFGGWPSILSLVVPPGESPANIARAAVAGLAPMSLPGGDAWVGVVRRAAEAKTMPSCPPSMRRRGRSSARGAPWRSAWILRTAMLGAAGLGCAGALAFALLIPAGQDAAPLGARLAVEDRGAWPLPGSAETEAQGAGAQSEAAASLPRLDKFELPSPDAAPRAPSLPRAADAEALAALPELPPLPPAPIGGSGPSPAPAEDDAPVADAEPTRPPAAASSEPRPGRDIARSGAATATPAPGPAASRCVAILAKAQLGEALTADDLRHMRRGC